MRALFLFTVASLVTAAAIAAVPDDNSAPLVIANRTITVFRASVQGYAPRERADGAARRIQAVLDEHGTVPSVEASSTAGGLVLLLGGKGMFLITAGDVNELAGDSPEAEAQRAVRALQRAIAEHFEQRNPRRLALSAALALAGTLLFAAFIWGLLALNHRVARKMSEFMLIGAKQIHETGSRVLDARHFLTFTRLVVALLGWALFIAAAYVWTAFVLERFPFSRPLGERLEQSIIEAMSGTGVAMLAAIPGLIFVAVIVLVARILQRLLRSLFDRIEAGKAVLWGLDADTVRPTRHLASAILWLFALAFAYPFLPGANTDAFKGLSILLGLMVTIGSTNLVGQAMSGLILMYSRAFRAAEFVRIGDSEGVVSDLGIFATRLRTPTGEEISLPNSLVLSSTTRNFSRALPGAGTLLTTSVTIGYATPWRQVHAMLEEAARRTAGLIADPAPRALQRALSDFYVEYALVAGADSKVGRGEVLSRLHANIQDVFNEHGVQIMSPHYRGDPAQPQVVPKENWFAPPARREGRDA